MEKVNKVLQLYPNYNELPGNQRLKILDSLFTGNNEILQLRRKLEEEH